MGKPNIIPVPVAGDQLGIIDAFRKINQVLGRESVPVFNGIEVSGTIILDDLTASRLIASSSDKELVSVDLASWVAAGSGVTVTDDGDGTITLAALASGIDHGGLAGLTDDDHSLYHTDARAVTWLAANHETTYDHVNYNTAYSHITNNGTDHSYIDQDVKTTASPAFAHFKYNDSNQAISIGTGASDTLVANTALGYQAGYNTAITTCTFIGRKAGYNNTGSRQTAIGSFAGYNNSGSYNMAIGDTSFYENRGDYCSGVGRSSGYYNQGDYNCAFGDSSGYGSTGTFILAFGTSACIRCDASRVAGIGCNSFGNFDQDSANAEVVDSVNYTDNQVTITGHGFGSAGTCLNLLPSTTGTLPTGLAAAERIWEVIDANTLECIDDTFSDAGSGTLTLIPQFKYDNSIAIGYNAEPDDSNQLIIMNPAASSTPIIKANMGTGSEKIEFAGPCLIKEVSAARDDEAGYGQLWVKNTTPCEPWYTDDAGTDSLIVLNNSAPVFTSLNITGPLLTTPEEGTLEFDSNRFYITNKSLRKSIDRTSDTKLTTTTVVSTAVETEVFSASVPIGSWVAGNILKLYMAGDITNKASSNDVTINVKVGGDTIATISSIGGKLTGACWEVEGTCIIRTVGSTGEMAWHMDMFIDGCTDDASCGVSEIDTTGALDITVTATWDTADDDNEFVCTMGFMEYKN